MASHPIQCACGSLKGQLDNPASSLRTVCYCKDCQAFAHFLGKPDEVMDSAGGTDVIQNKPANVRFTNGLENLACMKLTDKGLLRWYASCCNTPIGNTPADMKIPFAGLIHNCLHGEEELPPATFRPVQTRVNTGSAIGEQMPASTGMAGYLLRVVGLILKARIDGSYKRTPFFDPETGKPIVEPKVLTASELAQVKSLEQPN